MADSSLAEGRFKFFLGATEWGPGQLKEEIEAGAWLVLDCDAELVRARRPDPISNPVHSEPAPSPPPSPPPSPAPSPLASPSPGDEGPRLGMAARPA